MLIGLKLVCSECLKNVWVTGILFSHTILFVFKLQNLSKIILRCKLMKNFFNGEHYRIREETLIILGYYIQN